MTISLNIRAIRSIWLRFAVLSLMIVPAFWEIVIDLEDDYIEILLGFSLVALFMVFITVSVGHRMYLEWLAGAFFLALLVILPQALFYRAFPHLPDSIQHFFAGSNPKRFPTIDDKFLGLVKQLTQMVTWIPFTIFAVHCFSFADALPRLIKFRFLNRDRLRRLIITLRVVQHGLEVIPPLLDIWKEEYPTRVWPRFRSDYPGVIGFFKMLVMWVVEGMLVWGRALMVFVFRPIPLFCRELEILMPITLETKGPK